MTDGEIENVGSQGAPAKPPVTAVAPVWHTVLLIVVMFGLTALQLLPQVKTQASREPSRLPTYILTIAYEFLLVGYVWAFGLRLYRVPLAEIIGGKWKRWRDFWLDVGIAFVFWLVVLVMLLVVSRILHFSGMEAAKPLLPQTSLELAVFVVLSISAGFCEEIIFRGYLLRQFTAWTGNVVAGVALQAVVFGVPHLYQGGKGMIVITLYGVLFGILAAWRKSLRPGILQHGAQDSISGIGYHFAMKYKMLHMVRF